MEVSPVGLRLTEQFEGFRNLRYLDSGGVPTIGFGTTSAALGGALVPETCTYAEATIWLERDMNASVIPALAEACAVGERDLNQNQIDALADAGYNLGAGIFQDDHTLGLRIRNLYYPPSDIAEALLLYEYDGTVKLAGLVTRRETEVALFNRAATPKPKPVHNGSMDRGADPSVGRESDRT